MRWRLSAVSVSMSLSDAIKGVGEELDAVVSDVCAVAESDDVESSANAGSCHVVGDGDPAAIAVREVSVSMSMSITMGMREKSDIVV